MRTGIRRVAIGGALLVALAVVAWLVWPRPTPTPAWAADYDVSARQPDTITPGTVVDRSAPAGWSHLVIKSLPRVRPGEESKVPPLVRSETIRKVRWLFTAFTADVRSETRVNETQYHLRAIGLGMGTSVSGRDTIITPETASEHGVELDWITKEILKKGYETQRLAMVVVHGPTFGVVDTPVWYRWGEKNHLVRFRYALLVDAPTGRLDVLAWLLDPDGGCGDSGAVLLNPNQIDEAELIPDPKGFDLLGIASDSAFGVDRLPPHRARVLLPTELRTLAAATKLTPDDARALETALRRLLAP
jgi:hypothetical protein